MSDELFGKLICLLIAVILAAAVMVVQVWFFNWDWRCAIVRCAIMK